ncbi:hypothetical protein [Streptomyces canus]|uniref:hypothetical protein n=1 Tax=Streptomyces canus TaxID=58343 RepID=UPI0038096885
MTQRELEKVLSPSLTLLQRWSRAKRRQAARRSLRSMMRIYCPDLLDAFDDAVARRAEWVKTHRKKIRKSRKEGLTEAEFCALQRDMLETMNSLDSIRSRLSELILAWFPVGEAPR